MDRDYDPFPVYAGQRIDCVAGETGKRLGYWLCLRAGWGGIWEWHDA